MMKSPPQAEPATVASLIDIVLEACSFDIDVAMQTLVVAMGVMWAENIGDPDEHLDRIIKLIPEAARTARTELREVRQ